MSLDIVTSNIVDGRGLDASSMNVGVSAYLMM